MPETFEDGNGSSYAVLEWVNLAWSGLPEGMSFANAPTQMVANTQMCVYVFGTPYASGTFEVTVTGELMVNVFGSPYSAGQFTSSFTMVITPSIEGIWGCTYSNASNFLPVATNEDGSCIFEGCTDTDADNFQIFATVDDGSCTYGQQPTGRVPI